MKRKIKVLLSSVIVIGTITVCSIPLLAANKATFNPYYTGTGVGSVLTQTRGITATGTKYRAHCDWATGGCKITISFQSGPSTPKLGANQTHYLTRTPSSSGNVNVTGSLSHGTSSGGVQAYIEKQY